MLSQISASSSCLCGACFVPPATDQRGENVTERHELRVPGSKEDVNAWNVMEEAWFLFGIISLRNGLTAPGWSMCLSQVLCHPGNHGDHDDRLDAIWSQPHKKPCMHTRAWPHTRWQKQAADGGQATRPVSREGLRDTGGEIGGERETRQREGRPGETKKHGDREGEGRGMGAGPQLVQLLGGLYLEEQSAFMQHANLPCLESGEWGQGRKGREERTSGKTPSHTQGEACCKWAFAQFCPLQQLLPSTTGQVSDEVRREPHGAEQRDPTPALCHQEDCCHTPMILSGIYELGGMELFHPEDPKFVHQTHSY